MGYAFNVILGFPMAIILYIFTEKIIVNLTLNNKFNERIQKGFIMSFIIGMTFIALGLTVFGENSNINNHSLRLALYGAGSFLILNSVVFSWDDLDEETKIIILGIGISFFIFYSYNNMKIL